MNFYLTYLDTYEEDGETYYRFQAGLFTGTALEEWLLRSSGIDSIDLLSMPSYIPEIIEEGTITKSWEGTSFEAPADLYFHWIEEAEPIAVFQPIFDIDDFFDTGLASQPIVVYKNTPPSTVSIFPATRNPFGDLAPNFEAYPYWYVPEFSSGGILIIASRKSSTPFWTHANFSRFFAYGDNTYTCTGLPYNIHVTCAES